MKIKSQTYHWFNKLSAVAMILALLWLTVSAPFVNAAAEKLEQAGSFSHIGHQNGSNDEEAPSPLGNATEEKAGNGVGFSEEYLHGHDKADYLYSNAELKHSSEHTDTYNAFHGEVQVPPPNRA